MRPVLIGVLSLLPSLSATGEDDLWVNPVPRAIRTTLVQEWTFLAGNEGWTAENQCTLTVDEGLLRVESTDSDPFFHRPVDLPGGQVAVMLRIRSRVGGPGSVFWTTDRAARRGEDKRADFLVPDDGKWQEVAAHFHAPGTITDLRIDPSVFPGTTEIDSIRLVHERHHPLLVSAVKYAPDHVAFEVKNEESRPVTFTVSGKTQTLEGSQTRWFSRRIEGTKPLEPVRLAIECEGWPLLERTVVVHEPAVKTAWIARPLDDCMVRVARDGSVARIDRQGQLVAVLGPLVMRDGQTVPLTLVDDGDVLQFRGDNIQLSLAMSGKEINVSIHSNEVCEGPVVRVAGGLEQGLFAGLEYLGKGERGSSKLDIETAEHIRFAPDPLKVTMPLMAFVTDRGSVAMTWDDMRLQPVYATPNFFDVTSDHRMTLQGKTIDARLRFEEVALEESIAWAVNHMKLPPLPAPPRTDRQQREICLTALNGPLKTDAGWGHCVQERWERQPLADMASTVWRLGGDLPELPRLVPGGAHVPNDTVYFVTGRAREWLDVKRRQIRALIDGQQPDGSYRYDGPYRRGHFENTASGICATPAARMLEYAYITGDREAIEAGLHTLAFMKRFRTPRGAQTWECALHTPDQLASAYLVWAYVRGYQLTGETGYLQQARKWALSGVPFTYLWDSYPIMRYATPPVYGATHWKAPNWMGLPVQWVGGVYAYALALLAPYDDTLDWNHLARGILYSAEQQQYPDGPHIGLLPDSFHIRLQRRQPADINPCALVSLRMALEGQVDSLCVAANETHRVAAPFRVSLHDRNAVIDGRHGVHYQVLINGQQVVDVRSTGRDTIPLP